MAFSQRTPTVESPCVDVCVMDEDSGYCVGCRRTLDEIATWGVVSDVERLAVLARLDGRDPTPVRSPQA